MPYIMMKRSDVPAGVLQVLDMDPNTSLRNLTLDVPEVSSKIAFGGLLVGSGTIWLDDFKIEEVDTSVRTTGSSSSSEPRNLGFE